MAQQVRALIDRDHYARAALRAAEQAAAAIMVYFRRPLAVRQKADRSPVTAADLAAHAAIAAELEPLGLPIVSEEAAAERAEWRRFWLVDPLDGTREFVAGIDEFTVNIALIDQGRPILGVLAAPARGEYAIGVPGDGAERRGADGRWQALDARRRPPGPWRIALSRFHGDAELDAIGARLGGVEPVVLGSALKFLALAMGTVDLYPRRRAALREWDLAAGDALLSAAGGALYDDRGAPPRYLGDPERRFASFLACADPSQRWRERLAWP